MIDQSTISQIIDTAQIEEVVGDFVILKKRGVNYIGNCPFHQEKSPSFTVSPSKGIYKCFGCGKAGNSINFVMEHEHYNYPDALRYLAKKYNIFIEEIEPNPAQKEQQLEKESLFLINEFAAQFFKNYLNDAQSNFIGKSYLHERGFKEEIIQKFNLGYAPNDFHGLVNAAKAKAYQLNLLEKLGLIIQKEDKSYFDRFRDRIMFPIYNSSGRIIGFGGRILKKDDKTAKYLNSPESEIYHKGDQLYGFHLSKKAIIQADNCFLVEGYTDVISLHQIGIENVVASSGTSLTINQIKLIKKFTKNITILFDGDMAGIKAAFRGIDLILEQGLNVKVLLFPDNEDPDSFSKKNGAYPTQTYIKENSQDFITFKTKILLSEVKDDPFKRADLIKNIVQSIAFIPDLITKDIYLQKCSQYLQIDQEILYTELRKINRKKQENEQLTTKNAEENFAENIQEKKKKSQIAFEQNDEEKEIMRLLINFGNYTVQINEEEISLAEYLIGELLHDELFFNDSTFESMYQLYQKALNENQFPDLKAWSNDPDLQEKTIHLLAEKEKYSLSNWEKKEVFVPKDEEVLKKLAQKAILLFKLKHLDNRIRKIDEKLQISATTEDLNVTLQEKMIFLQIKKQITQKFGIIYK